MIEAVFYSTFAGSVCSPIVLVWCHMIGLVFQKAIQVTQLTIKSTEEKLLRCLSNYSPSFLVKSKSTPDLLWECWSVVVQTSILGRCHNYK